MLGKVAWMSGVYETSILDFEVPRPEKGAVIMKTLKANVCGSDIHIWSGKHVLHDHVPGHECMGVIHELGDGVSTDYAGRDVHVGDRIVPVYYLVCNKCVQCQNGLYNICDHGNDLAAQPAQQWPHFTGAFATHYYIAPGQHFYKIPDNIPDDLAAGINCGITQMFYALEKAHLHAGQNVVIQGAGGLGLFSTAIAKESGAKAIIIDSVEERLNNAREFGADHIINMNEFATVEARRAEINRLTGNAGADIVVEVAGVPAAFSESLYLARKGGTIVEVGNVLAKEEFNTTIVPGVIVRNCLQIIGLVRYLPSYLNKTLSFVSGCFDKYPWNGMSDRYYTLEETQLALQNSAERKVQRAVIAPNMDL